MYLSATLVCESGADWYKGTDKDFSMIAENSMDFVSSTLVIFDDHAF